MKKEKYSTQECMLLGPLWVPPPPAPHKISALAFLADKNKANPEKGRVKGGGKNES